MNLIGLFLVAKGGINFVVVAVTYFTEAEALTTITT